MKDHLSRRDVLRGAAAAGACAATGWLCPALAQQLHAPEASLDRWYRGVCGQCGMTDPLFVGVRGGSPVTVKGDPVSPANYGRLCTRGMAFPAGLAPDRRPLKPLLRRDPSTKGTDAGLEPVEWDEALGWITQRIGPIARQEPSKLAAFLDTSMPTESHLVFNRLFKGHLGCANVESNLRLDAASGLMAAEEAVGIPAPLGGAGGIDGADLLMVVGADPAERHPTLFSRMLQCHRRGTTRMVLIDSRRTLTAGLADVFVQPRVPGTEHLVLHSIAQLLIRDGHVDEADARDRRSPFLPEMVESICGVRAADIEAAAEAFADSYATFSCFGHGLTTGAVRSLYDLHILTGKMGDGSTILPLLDGANAQGALLMGSCADRLPGLRSADAEADRSAVATAWQVGRLHDGAGLQLGDWLPALERDELSTLFVAGSNLLPLLPDNRRWRAAFGRATVVAASPFEPTETTAYSDLVLPMALPWLEERGCFVNQARQVLLTDPAGPPEGVPTSLSLATRLASALLGEDDTAFAAYDKFGPELAWEQCRALTAGRPCDLSGADYGVLGGTITWPHPEGTDDSRELEPRFQNLSPAPRKTVWPAKTDAELSLVVFADSHHTGARELTGFAPELHYAAPRAWLEVNGRDAVQRKLRDGDWVAAVSDTGVLVARLWITDRVPRGVVGIPEHFGFLSDLEGGTDGRGEPESLPGLGIPTRTDPDSGQIILSGTKITLRKPTEQEMGVRGLK